MIYRDENHVLQIPHRIAVLGVRLCRNEQPSQITRHGR
jgi:hypothetical protein